MNKIIIFCFILLSLVGCAPVDLNYHFPTSMAIEYKDNKYVVSVVIPSLEENSNKNSNEVPPLVIVRGGGDTLSQAIEKMNLKEKGRISGVHIRSIIFHKSLFEDTNITYESICKYFVDSVEFRLNTLVYITDENIDDLLSTENPLTTNAFNNISDKTKSQYYNKFKFPTLVDTMIDYYENRDFYLPQVYINDKVLSSKEDGNLNKQSIYDINNFCYIKEHIICIDKEELKGLSYYQEKSSNDIEYGEENEVLSGIIKKVRTRIDYKKIAKIKVKVNISISDNLSNRDKEEVKDIFEDEIKNSIENTYTIASSSNIDVYHIKDGYRRYKDKVINISNMKLEIDVDVRLVNSRLK